MLTYRPFPTMQKTETEIVKHNTKDRAVIER
jgi:hypothetical protein